MPRSLRILTAAADSPATTTTNNPATSNSTDQQAAVGTVDSDFVVILASLLCALICVLGLVAVARCAWLRRLSSTSVPRAAGQHHQPPQSSSNKGLKKKVLRSLPKQTFSPESAPKTSDCAICLTEFAAGEEIRVLPQCGHCFHVSCIDTWLGSHSSCPSCRQILVVARCQKCGGVPSTSNGNGGETESRMKEREDGVANSFLP